MKEKRIAHLLEMLDYHADAFASIPLTNVQDAGKIAVLLISSVLGYQVVVLLIEDKIKGPQLVASKGIDKDSPGAWTNREAFVRYLCGVIDSPSIFECNTLDKGSAASARRLGLGESFLAVPLRGSPEYGKDRVGFVIAAQPHGDYDPNVDIMAVRIIAGIVRGAISKCMAGTKLLEIHEAMDTEIDRRKLAEGALLKSERKYSTLVENSLTGIFTHQDGRYVFVNDRFAEIHGYTAEELIGKEYLTLIHPDERDAKAQIASSRLKGEAVPELYEVRRLRKSGETIWCDMMATRIEYGGRPAIMGNITDITERKRAEEALRESEETYHSVLESCPDPIVVYDMEGKCTYLNPAFTTVFGWTPEELIGKKLDYVPDENWPETKLMIDTVMAGESFFGVESRRHTKYGNILDVSISAAIHLSRDGSPVGSIHFLRDITERKRAEKALRESVHRVQIAYDQSIIYAAQLKEEIVERKRVGDSLQQRKEELKAQAHELEEMNSALSVLLRHREKDKNELEKKVLSNVKELILPYIQTLEKTRLNAKQTAYVHIIESNLSTIVSPFLQKLTSRFLALTPKEIQVAGLVKEGKTSKEIAEFSNVSPKAVEFHRMNIRTKLGLKNKKANLRSHLLSLT